MAVLAGDALNKYVVGEAWCKQMRISMSIIGLTYVHHSEHGKSAQSYFISRALQMTFAILALRQK